MKTALLFLAIFLSAAVPHASACLFAPPPADVWLTDKGKAVDVRRSNTDGVVTVFAAGKRDTALWSVKLIGFSGLFSTVHVLEGGDRIVHIRGNHQVSKLTDSVIIIHDRDGSVKRHLASEFIDFLLRPIPGEPIISGDPGARWLSTAAVGNDQIVIKNARGKTHTLAL